MQELAVKKSEAKNSKLTEMAKEHGMTSTNLVRILTSSGLENLSSYPLEKRIEIVKSKLNHNDKE